MNFFSWRFGKKDVTACDADTPPISITPNNSAGHTLVNMPTGSGKAVAKGVTQQSLEEHDKRFHHGHYDGGSCKYREQNGIKTGAAGTGGTGTATPTTTSPAPSSKPITIQEKAEIREEDTLSKNVGQADYLKQKGWNPNIDPVSGARKDGVKGSNWENMERNREFARQLGLGTPGSYVDTGLPWKPESRFTPYDGRGRIRPDDLPKIPRGPISYEQIGTWKVADKKGSRENKIREILGFSKDQKIPTAVRDLLNFAMDIDEGVSDKFAGSVGAVDVLKMAADKKGISLEEWVKNAIDEGRNGIIGRLDDRFGRPSFGRIKESDLGHLMRKACDELFKDAAPKGEYDIPIWKRDFREYLVRNLDQIKNVKPKALQERFVQGAISNSFGNANSQGMKDRATVETSEDGDSVFFTAHSKEDADKFVAALKAEADRTGREVNVMTGWDDDADDENGHRQIQIEIVGRGEEKPGNPPMTKSVGSPTASKPWWMPSGESDSKQPTFLPGRRWWMPPIDEPDDSWPRDSTGKPRWVRDPEKLR